MIGEYDSSGVVIAEHIYLGSTPVAVVKSGTIYYVHTDHLGTPRVINNTSGTVVWKWDNTNAYGYNSANETVSGPLFEYNIRFAGQYFDKESGLHYNYHRMYNPELGRYMQPDPIGVAGGMNLYSYVENNPLNASDPYGLKRFFAGDKTVDTQMLNSWNNDDDDKNKLIIYGHGSKKGFFVNNNNSLNHNFDVSEKYVNGSFIKNAIEFKNMLEANNININDYNEVEFRSCDIARSRLAQDIANTFNKIVYAAGDYYFFGDRSVGVKQTIRKMVPNKDTGREDEKYWLPLFPKILPLQKFTPLRN